MPMNSVWAWAEQREGELVEVTRELLGEARDLAGAEGQVAAVLLGEDVRGLAEALGQDGADRVYLGEAPLLGTYTTDAYVDALAALIQSPLAGRGKAGNQPPGLLLIGATANGRDLAPRLAARLRVPFTGNCLQVVARPDSDGGLVATRSIYADRVYGLSALPAAPFQVATLRPGVRGVDSPGTARKAQVVKFGPKLDAQRLRTRSLGVVPSDPRTLDLAEAEVVVAGGQGVGGKDQFDQIWQLADLLGAAVGGSRVAVDRGWLEFERQIGQTGKVIHPRVYVAAGISGAAQHTTGIRDSETVVVINQDRTAPIFALADLGLVGDLHAVLPAVIQRLEQAAGKGDGPLPPAPSPLGEGES